MNPHPHPSPCDGPPDHATPSLRVCVALLRWNGSRLEAAIVGGDALPSTIPSADEAVDSAALRLIREAAGVDAQYLEQLYTFSPSHGSPRQIVISYLGLFAPNTTDPPHATPISWRLAEGLRLADDLDRSVLEYALVRLRAKLGYTNIAFYLLPATFTLSELQQTYERILGQPMDKRNFRRRITSSGILIDTGEKRREGSHRPAALYRFREEADQSSYLTPHLQASPPASPDEGA